MRLMTVQSDAIGTDLAPSVLADSGGGLARLIGALVRPEIGFALPLSVDAADLDVD
jgi:hypothetical protein